MSVNKGIVDDIKKKIQVLKKQKTIDKDKSDKNTNLDIVISKDTLKQFKKSKN